MNDDEHLDDSALTAELVDSLAEVAVPGRPPLAAITDRGRVYKRRRLAGFAGLCVTGGAAVIALVLGLTGVFGASPAGGTGTGQAADFTLTSYVNGTVALHLGQIFDPAALQRALAHHGIRALVMNDTYCSSSPAVPNPIIGGVLPGSATPPRGHGVQRILMTANFPVKPSQLAPSVDPVTAGDQPCGDALRDRAVHRLLRPRAHLLLGPHLHRLPHLRHRPEAARPSPLGQAPVSRALMTRPPACARTQNPARPR